MAEFKVKTDGWFVVCPDGRVGLAVDRDDANKVVVQFGSGGPFESYGDKVLRYASESDVLRAGLYGVGGTIHGQPRIVRRNWTGEP